MFLSHITSCDKAKTATVLGSLLWPERFIPRLRDPTDNTRVKERVGGVMVGVARRLQHRGRKRFREMAILRLVID